MHLLKNSFAAILLMAFFACHSVPATAHNPEAPEQGLVTAGEQFAFSLFPVAGSQKLHFTYVNSDQQRVTVRFYDQKGNLIATDALKNAEGYHKLYKFETLGNGSYTVEIVCGNITEQRTISLGKGQGNQAFLAFISPTLRDNKVKVAFQHANSPVVVAVKDIRGQILYSQEITPAQNFASLLNLQRLQKGEYIVSVTDGNRSFEKVYFRD
jgi:hypothetical protein